MLTANVHEKRDVHASVNMAKPVNIGPKAAGSTPVEARLSANQATSDPSVRSGA